MADKKKGTPYFKLKMRRMELGYRSSDVAKALGMQRWAYMQRENGQTEFRLKEIVQLLEIMKCDFKDLF